MTHPLVAGTRQTKKTRGQVHSSDHDPNRDFLYHSTLARVQALCRLTPITCRPGPGKLLISAMGQLPSY